MWLRKPCVWGTLLMVSLAMGSEAVREEVLRADNLNPFVSGTLKDSIRWRAFLAAQESAAGGEWSRARELVGRLHGIMPNNLMLLEQKARLHQLAGEWAQAEQAWYELFAKRPQRLDVLVELAGVLMRQGKGPETARILDVMIERFPEHMEARFLRAVLEVKDDRQPRTNEQWTVLEQAGLCYRLGSESRAWVTWLGDEGYRSLVAFVWSGGLWSDPDWVPQAPGVVAERCLALGPHLVELEHAMALEQPERAWAALRRAEGEGAVGPLIAAYRGYLDRDVSVLSAVLDVHPEHRQVRQMRGSLLLEKAAYREALTDFDLLARDGRLVSADVRFGRLLAFLGLENLDAALEIFRELADTQRQDLLRLLRQNEPLLDALRRHPDFLNVLQNPEPGNSDAP